MRRATVGTHATRRGFLAGAGAAAAGAGAAAAGAGAAAAGAGAAAAGTELLGPPQAQPAQAKGRPAGIRGAAAEAKRLCDLGPLRELGGTWVGRGFNVISLPDFDNLAGPQPFRVKVDATIETLAFTPIGGPVPNRGSNGQKDIKLHGFSYLQRISNALDSSAMHIEPGFWLRVPATQVPLLGETIVRQGSIPHGTSVMAIGQPIPLVKGGPKIGVASTRPIANPPRNPDPITPAYLARFPVAPPPPDFPQPFLDDPNLALKAAIVGQNIVETVVLDVSTSPRGIDQALFPTGVLNIPFLTKNANATRMDAIFWIEKVQQDDGSHFFQLQYTQTVLLHFLDIDWPHISVATLVKQ